jgi:hypothetical protein
LPEIDPFPRTPARLIGPRRSPNPEHVRGASELSIRQDIKKSVIGMICPYWLPMRGGAEQNHFRLASKLHDRGFAARVF